MSDESMVSESEFRMARRTIVVMTGAVAGGADVVRLSAALAICVGKAFDALEHAVCNLGDVVESRQQEIDQGYKKIEQLQRRLRDSKAECEQLRMGEAKEAEPTPISEAQFLEGRDLVATLILALGTKGDREVAVAASHVQAIARSLRYLAAQRDQARAERDAARAAADSWMRTVVDNGRKEEALQRKVGELEYIATEQGERAEALLAEREAARADAIRLGKAAEMNFRRADTLSVQVARQKESIEDLGRDLEAARAENGRLRGQLQAVKNFCQLDLGEQVF